MHLNESNLQDDLRLIQHEHIEYSVHFLFLTLTLLHVNLRNQL